MSMMPANQSPINTLLMLLIILSTNGCHSSSNNVSAPNDDDVTPTLSETNWRPIIGEVFDVFTQAIYNDQLIQPAFSTIEGQRYEFPFVNSNYANYTENKCTEGGVITHRSSPTSCDGRCFSSTTMLYGCTSNGLSYLGRIETDSGYSSSSKMHDALTLTIGDSQQFYINGTLGFSRLGSKISGNIRRNAMVSRYESSSDSGIIVLTDVETVFGYGTDQGDATASAELQGQFIIRSPATGDVSISASVSEPFINENSDVRRFPSGMLTLKAEDGSRIDITASNGDADTFDISVSSRDNDAVNFSEPWDTWIERLSF